MHRCLLGVFPAFSTSKEECQERWRTYLRHFDEELKNQRSKQSQGDSRKGEFRLFADRLEFSERLLEHEFFPPETYRASLREFVDLAGELATTVREEEENLKNGLPSNRSYDRANQSFSDFLAALEEEYPIGASRQSPEKYNKILAARFSQFWRTAQQLAANEDELSIEPNVEVAARNRDLFHRYERLKTQLDRLLSFPSVLEKDSLERQRIHFDQVRLYQDYKQTYETERKDAIGIPSDQPFSLSENGTLIKTVRLSTREFGRYKYLVSGDEGQKRDPVWLLFSLFSGAPIPIDEAQTTPLYSDIERQWSKTLAWPRSQLYSYFRNSSEFEEMYRDLSRAERKKYLQLKEDEGDGVAGAYALGVVLAERTIDPTSLNKKFLDVVAEVSGVPSGKIVGLHYLTIEGDVMETMAPHMHVDISKNLPFVAGF